MITLDFKNLYETIKMGVDPKRTLDRKKDKWIFDLDRFDSTQFDHADMLQPLGKLFETSKIVSIVFADYYDYKSAIHIFNFTKPDIVPVSSFILYNNGGDAEDFWKTEAKNVVHLSLISLRHRLLLRLSKTGYDFHFKERTRKNLD